VFHNKFFEYEICKITWESFLSPTSDIFFRTLLTSSSVVVISVLGFGTSWVGRKSISYFRTFGFISYGWGITYYITLHYIADRESVPKWEFYFLLSRNSLLSVHWFRNSFQEISSFAEYPTATLKEYPYHPRRSSLLYSWHNLIDMLPPRQNVINCRGIMGWFFLPPSKFALCYNERKACIVENPANSERVPRAARVLV